MFDWNDSEGAPAREDEPQDVLKRMFERTQIVEDWKKGNWSALEQWIGNFDISLLCTTDENLQPIKLISLDSSNPI